jgi:hypothetical protein
MPRWAKKDRDGLAAMRVACAEALEESPAWPEVIGDRKLLRFLQGHEYNVEKASEMYGKFLNWRKENKINDIRHSILSGGLDHPTKFPFADTVLSLMPSLAISPDACDKKGSPICVDQYDFEPSEVLEKIGVPNYIVFAIHVLEYKSIILEQMSEHRDREYLASLPDDESRAAAEYIPSYVDGTPTEPETEAWGNICTTLVIRDLGGVGFRHLGSTGQDIIKSVVAISSDNYPELMRRCFMINTPWVFTSIWYLIKGWIAAKTVAKVSLLGGSYMTEFLEEIDEDNIPEMCGGKCKKNSSLIYFKYPFDMEYLEDTDYTAKVNQTVTTAATDGESSPTTVFSGTLE